ncbi:hypothetical protein, partial [Stenotrophomonas maltophilia group sp. RNC7]|uniref:hypothetical protein n=1 Tax=Stenotrophomonas maltophilia group sp. RNC7 TaxID=3071467 RepID=UPI0027E080ED
MIDEQQVHKGFLIQQSKCVRNGRSTFTQSYSQAGSRRAMGGASVRRRETISANGNSSRTRFR